MSALYHRGRTSYEQTVPEMARQLTRLGDQLDRPVDEQPVGCSGESVGRGDEIVARGTRDRGDPADRGGPAHDDECVPARDDGRASTRGATRTEHPDGDPR